MSKSSLWKTCNGGKIPPDWRRKMPDEKDDRVIAQSHLDLDARIRARAEEIYRGHGREGSELEDWLQAEREILGAGKQPAQARGSVVGPAKTPERTRAAG